MTAAQALAELRKRIADPDWPALPTRALVLAVADGDRALAVEVLDLLGTARDEQAADLAVRGKADEPADVEMTAHAVDLIGRAETKRGSARA